MTVTRLVLDSNYARNISESELAALKARGFSIALSLATFDEVWAHSSRKDKPGILYGPMKRLAKYLDGDRPILSVGRHLRDELEGITVLQRRRRRESFEARTKLLLRSLVAEGITEETWRLSGELINEQIDGLSDNWTATRQRALAKDYPPEIMALPDGELFRRLKPMFPGFDRVPRGLVERWDAYFSVVTLIAVRDAKKTPNQSAPHENDAEDLQLLHQLAQPSFVMTRDNGLLAFVDESGTYQAPWVKTFGELMTDPLPSGVPWGRSAKVQARSFTRRTRRELTALEESVRHQYR